VVVGETKWKEPRTLSLFSSLRKDWAAVSSSGSQKERKNKQKKKTKKKTAREENSKAALIRAGFLEYFID
jgi:hypothetical protein